MTVEQRPNKPLRMPQTGTDYRSDDIGKYSWPHPFWQRHGEPVEEFWAVSSVLQIMSDFGEAMQHWQAEHVVELATLADVKGLVEMARIMKDVLGNKRKAASVELERMWSIVSDRQMYERWDDSIKQMISVDPVDLLMDQRWLKGAGYRKLSRAAARGTVVHTVIEEWVYKFIGGSQAVDYTDDDTVKSYTIETIEDERRRRGSFFIDWEECWEYVQQALRWLDMHVLRVHMAETAVFNRTFGYAGTVDLDVELKHADGLWRIDAKTSANHYDSHRIQLAAYANAEFAAVGHGQQLEPLPRPDRVANLYIGTDKAVLREWWTDKKSVEQRDECMMDFVVFTTLLKIVMPRVTKQKGDDGRFHAINPVTVKACTNRATKGSKEDEE